jgi:multidrug efflux pump subunit AcrB
VVEESVGEFLLKFVVALSVVMLVSFLSLGFRAGCSAPKGSGIPAT